jgi:hypothetical protein
MSNGAKKGPPFERELCKLFSQWWDGRDDVFWRTSGSGARATSRSRKGKKTKYEYGDMTFTDPVGKPLVDLILWEFKRGYSKSIDMLALLDGRSSLLGKWIAKAEEDRRESDRKYVCLVLQRDRKEKVLAIHSALLGWLEGQIGEFKGQSIRVSSFPLEFILLKDFLTWCNRQAVEEIWNSL